MSDKSFELTIVTPERVTFQGRADSLSLPAWEGSMGVLPGHQSALVLLQEGVVAFRDTQGEHALSVSGGFAEIGPQKTVLFAETAELAEELSEERARLAAARAKEEVTGARAKKKGFEQVDIEQAQASLRRALVRLKATETIRRRRSSPPQAHG